MSARYRRKSAVGEAGKSGGAEVPGREGAAPGEGEVDAAEQAERDRIEASIARQMAAQAAENPDAFRMFTVTPEELEALHEAIWSGKLH